MYGVDRVGGWFAVAAETSQKIGGECLPQKERPGSSQEEVHPRGSDTKIVGSKKKRKVSE